MPINFATITFTACITWYTHLYILRVALAHFVLELKNFTYKISVNVVSLITLNCA